MKFSFHQAWSEDEIISLLCGPFSGISTALLVDAMSSAPENGDNLCIGVDNNDVKGITRLPKRKYTDFAFESPTCPDSGPSKTQKLVDEAIVIVIDNIVIASELESMGNDDDKEDEIETEGVVHTETEGVVDTKTDSVADTKTDGVEILTQLGGQNSQVETEGTETE